MVNSHISRALADARLADIHREMRINRPLPASVEDESRSLPRPGFSRGLLPSARW
jgi:hypothetical protein